MSTTCRHADQPDEILLAFARALRAAGVPVTPDRAPELPRRDRAGRPRRPARDLRRRAGPRSARSPDDLVRYDQVFAAFFDARDGLPRERPAAPSKPAYSSLTRTDEPGAGGERRHDDDVVRALASDVEVLRHRDVATMTPAEKARMAAMFATLRPRPPLRRTLRHEPWRRGQVDARAHAARQPAPRSASRRRSATATGAPGRAGWCCCVDVSGSMSGTPTRCCAWPTR